MTRTVPAGTDSARPRPARTGLARAAVLALAVAAPLAAGVLTAGPASAEPPASVVVELPTSGLGGFYSVVATDALGRKLK